MCMDVCIRQPAVADMCTRKSAGGFAMYWHAPPGYQLTGRVPNWCELAPACGKLLGASAKVRGHLWGLVRTKQCAHPTLAVTVLGALKARLGDTHGNVPWQPADWGRASEQNYLLWCRRNYSLTAPCGWSPRSFEGACGRNSMHRAVAIGLVGIWRSGGNNALSSGRNSLIASPQRQMHVLP